ncbi:carbohydrate ABC transporter permease [Arthrobacter sp. SA17]
MSVQSDQQGQSEIVAPAVEHSGKPPLDTMRSGEDRGARDRGAGKRVRSTRYRRHKWAMFGFILPALVVYVLMVILPSLQTIQLSLTNWDGVNPRYKYIGITNYTSILTSGRFWNAVLNTLLLGLGSAVIINAISLGAALMLDKLNHLQGLFRTAVYLPALVSGFIAATIWKYILNYNFGLTNTVLRDAGLDPLTRDWLGDSDIVIWVLLFIICFTLGETPP